MTIGEYEDLGEQLKAEGMAAAAEAQDERCNHEWDHALGMFAIRRCAEMFEVFYSDDVHGFLEDHGLPEPEGPNAWGSCWKEARTGDNRFIEEAGDQPRRKSKRPQAHAKPMTPYRSLIGSGF